MPDLRIRKPAQQGRGHSCLLRGLRLAGAMAAVDSDKRLQFDRALKIYADPMPKAVSVSS